MPTVITPAEDEVAEVVCIGPCDVLPRLNYIQTIKGTTEPKTPANSQGYAAGKSVGRGDLDQAIRSMRDGRRRARPVATRPLSKMFLDGAPAGVR